MASKPNKKSEQSPQPDKPARKTRKAPDPAAKGPTEPSNRRKGLTVVGIGASAGGLAALRSFFNALPADPGVAFVVVTHLHPEHESHLAELLQRHTSMPTQQVTEKIQVQPNHVYVIPPNRAILMADSHLEPVEFTEPRGRRTPIDHFFRSLAAGHSESIAVILSGGGTDGSVGVKDIKEQGGLILVQTPSDAEYDSMPRAAINTGLADVVLPADQLARKLADYARHFPQIPHDPGQLTDQELETLQRILAQVRARTEHDFSQYKLSTILRRVERRMQLNGFTTLEGYLKFLRQSADEAQSMFNDILIGVTNFFRDRESWEALAEQVIPSLFEQKDENNEIRVWSIGCATGEEAYSLAMLLFEHAEGLDFRPRIQLFASDLDEGAIAHARDGLYPAAIEADVSPERLERFFTREGEYYRVKRELRDAVLFTNHNVLRDPPFSRQHLIACRNVLIYLQRPVQDLVFDIFHYALNPDGYLFLGSSETAEHVPDRFTVLDKNHRIYQARPWTEERPHVPTMPLSLRRDRRSSSKEQPSSTHSRLRRHLEESSVAEEQHYRALETYGPPSVIVNERYTILHVSETAGRYLLQPRGSITGDLLKLVRPELQLELRAALFQAFEKERATVSRAISVKFNGHPRRVVVGVRPRREASSLDRAAEKQALVLFLEDEINEPDETTPLPAPGHQADSSESVGRLEAEVQRLREQLQITIEEYDSSNEEMKAANEELQSINEEYRSATEELETSKEELQSVNEELQTVNSEMRGKLEELSRAHRELQNLMGATEIPTLFLDRQLRIQRYTAGIKNLFNIRQIDRGRRISDLTHKLGYNKFIEDAEQVMRGLIPMEREMQLGKGESYLIRLRPYYTADDQIEGLVITFIDITELKEIQRELILTKESLEQRVHDRTRDHDEANASLRQARDMFYALFHGNPIPAALVRIDDGIFLDINLAYLEYFGLAREDLVGHTWQEFDLPVGPAVQSTLITQLGKEGMIRDLELEINHPSGETRTILVSVQQVQLDGSSCVIATFIDITERVHAEQQIRALASRLTAGEQKERHRLARILHDELQQKIFAVKMQLIFLAEALEKNDLKNLKVDLHQLDTWLAEAIATTRQLSIDLSPPILQGEGLVEAIIWLAAQMKEQYSLDVAVQTNGVNPVFEEDVRVLIFQSVRELLFNVVKHSGTLEADVTFEQMDGKALIAVSDHGRGFESEKTMQDPEKAYGLSRMRQRLFLLGCDLEVKSKPNKGTEIAIVAPVKETMD
ncbi:MAG TPA: chemotaxis protein CheB [Anaerolineales bacterium]|nr:chemotaxis protein CheB [Anaerolineales bacterium]